MRPNSINPYFSFSVLHLVSLQEVRAFRFVAANGLLLDSPMLDREFRPPLAQYEVGRKVLLLLPY